MPDPELKRFRTATDEYQLTLSLLTNRKQRRRQRRFVVEGVRAINEAVAGGWGIDSFWFAADRPLSKWARSLIDAGVARTHVELAPELMAELSGKEVASELIAIVTIPDDDLARIDFRPGGLVVVFDRPVSPGNLGSVMRTCGALGADGLIVTGHSADIYDPQSVRASTGALFALPVVQAGSHGQVMKWVDSLRAGQPSLQVVGSSARATIEVTEIDFIRPTVLVLGNETKGLSWAWTEACDTVVVIPTSGARESLNVAAAAAILLFEVDRQRRS